MQLEHDTVAQRQEVLQSEKKGWNVFLPEPLRSQALDAATLVAERLREPEQVLAIAQKALPQSVLAKRLTPEGMVFGVGGIAFPCAYFAHCFPDQGWDRIAHRYLDSRTQPYSLTGASLFSMTSGMAMILALLSENGRRYRQTLIGLHTLLCDQIRSLPCRSGEGAGIAEREYDLISGATGVLAYLLTIDSPEEHLSAAIEKLLEYLIRLAETDPKSKREGWYISQQYIPLEATRQQYPSGYYNCGLAHGIPGPLAVLSLAWLSGYRTSGLRAAIHFLSEWLIEHALRDTWGINWPSVVPLETSYTVDAYKTLPSCRAAWCYGSPGIARALWFAGLALEDGQIRQTAIEAIEAVLRRPIAERRIDSPTLCHGIAGLLAICLRFAQDTDNETIRAHIPLLVNQILSHYNPDFPLGFRDLEMTNEGIDQTAWLTGAPGVALALLAASLPIEPAWDRMMLLS